jgi:rubrerythrin
MTKEERRSLIAARALAKATAPTDAPRKPRQRRTKAPRDPGERAKNRVRMAALIASRRAAGQCGKCGRPSPDKWACDTCRGQKAAAKQRLRNQRIADGLCPRCGAPAIPGGRLCEAHRTLVRERARAERGYQRVYGPRPRGTE